MVYIYVVLILVNGIDQEFQSNREGARRARSRRFAEALLTEAVELLLSGEVETGKAILRDYINATIGFERLATEDRHAVPRA